MKTFPPRSVESSDGIVANGIAVDTHKGTCTINVK
jgi:hypothetical protein